MNVSSAPAGKASLGAPDGGMEETFVDILVSFDGNVLSWTRKNGGGVTNFAQTAVQKMNLAIANTGLDASFRFRLVGVVGLAASSSSLDYVLDAAYYGWSGWEAIGDKREKVGADIVTVWSTRVRHTTRPGWVSAFTTPTSTGSPKECLQRRRHTLRRPVPYDDARSRA